MSLKVYKFVVCIKDNTTIKTMRTCYIPPRNNGDDDYDGDNE